jgi:hypothetical protein
MSTTRDTISTSIGIQRIMPTAETPRQVSKRKPQDNRDTDDGRSKSDPESQSPHPPGLGGLVDKAV